MKSSTERRVKANILFVFGLGWVSYFAFYNPQAMNPYFMTLGGSAMFGPAVVGLWRADNSSKSDKLEDDKE